MTDLIFGHTWDDIDAAQRGKRGLSCPVIHTPNATATPADIDLLASHGVPGLEKLQFFGVLDRLRTSGMI